MAIVDDDATGICAAFDGEPQIMGLDNARTGGRR
jgi:hypothetical protein